MGHLITAAAILFFFLLVHASEADETIEITRTDLAWIVFHIEKEPAWVKSGAAKIMRAYLSEHDGPTFIVDVTAYKEWKAAVGGKVAKGGPI